MDAIHSKFAKRLWLVLASLCLLAGTAHAGTVTYVYSDPQGTPLMEADAQGNITATLDYRPYGTQALGQAPSGPGYTGHVSDPEIGLVYMQARYYDPNVGRFLSVDPIGAGARDGFSFNRYAYASNSPASLRDPTGLYASNMTASEINCEVYHCEGGGGESERSQRAARATHAANNALRKASVLGGSFENSSTLAIAWSDAVVPIATKMQVEIGSDFMYMKDKGYFCSPAYSTGDQGTIIMEELGVDASSEIGKFAEIHTHPDNKGFSGTTAFAMPGDPFPHYSGADPGNDLPRYFQVKIDGYVALPNGAIYGWHRQPFTDEVDQRGWQPLGNAIYTVRKGE